MIDEHQEAIEYELICRGLRLRWLGTESLAWRDLLVVLRHLPDDNAINRGQLEPEERIWGLGTSLGVTNQVVALLADRLAVLIWQNTEDGQKNRNQPEPLARPGVNEAPKPPAREEIAEFDRWYADRFGASVN